jgi:polyisoprenoid-binding protein YceI
MMPRLWALGLLVCGLPAGASEWQVDHSASRLGFHTTQQDGQLEGEFRQWEAAIQFDPDHLEASLIDVIVQIGSITTGSRQRDMYLPDEEWFFTERFPHASFRATRVESRGDGYLARGELTLRGITQPIDLQFTWSSEGDTAEVRARTALERTRFGVGAGEFADSDVVGLEVQVVADLTLRRKRS